MLALLTSKLGLGLIAVALVLGVFTTQAVRLHLAQSEISGMKTAEAAATAEAERKAHAASQISADASVKNQAAQVQIINRTRTITKWIPSHVAPTDPHFYPWPTWGVSAYDASLGLSDAPGGFDDSPSAIGAADAARVFVANNGACRADQERLRGLQVWITDQAANWNGK